MQTLKYLQKNWLSTTTNHHHRIIDDLYGNFYSAVVVDRVCVCAMYVVRFSTNSAKFDVKSLLWAFITHFIQVPAL